MYSHNNWYKKQGQTSLVRLKWDRLKSMEIKITVLEPEKGLLQYCDSRRSSDLLFRGPISPTTVPCR